MTRPIRFLCWGMLLLLAFVPTEGIRAGVAPFTERGKVDFDEAIQLLNPYGTWHKVDDVWAYTPLDHSQPYTHGRWLYSEFGWYWQGTLPHSWATEHYGYCKRDANHVWSWYPGPIWLPQTVELRAAPDAVGWRSAQVDRDGNFVEQPADRYTKTDEWTFVTSQHFAGPVTPEVICRPEVAEKLLEDSSDSFHSYLTYRALERPGPHPADFMNLGDGGMLAPMSEQERAQKQQSKSNLTSDRGETDDQPDDPRQVPYWVTMSLPEPWTPRPVEAKRNELYVYRPDFYQDQDGIERRIAYWLDPKLRGLEAVHLQEALKRGEENRATHKATTAAAETGSSAGNPFSGQLEKSIHVASPVPPKSPGNSPLTAAGAPVPTAASPAPAGLAPANTSAPSGLAGSASHPSPEVDAPETNAPTSNMP